MSNSSKAIFLDIDGVLCSHRCDEAYGYSVFDPEAVGYLKALCDESGAKLVVCSTWLGRDNEALHEKLKESGLDAYLHDDWRTGKDGQEVYGRNKASLIVKWANDHALVPEDALILDDKLHRDNRLPKAWQERVVAPTIKNGMQQEHYVQAKQKLGLPIVSPEEQTILQANQQRGR